ncbi:MAG: PEP-CTERM-box response regulator transcription factor [Candidatus Schekmanbacteria bacterium RIFCSPHIGHO2_02_FULL_38_11]|uniref:PEP-CTERM-box response regulator transcription factor n=1 Tax=Candidatus Schekmanbacteria bacterium RIFCSPLOWO2_12_FULL_38_15 TaxID=1817883 RepID=A0A1F7SMY7_9BACT|nr:MAG: PEP-CTERM-box response regulator transcription factor [Candidatus Schekmanbacteria bacterium GWA2_38_9]OGL50027.1 MAG: PEP-CTERM-box response regulator transcription factor [Candidatus Schekmanbacteria bacterium RIFCSPHIGHO2_02_FULL_38_11]OGL51142.1 MAG: PEP-CTERM-box response regulator transcription factor [Candidatus Schekmanbacteria bacterium RIFCSPLOWO2_02_FULL_38_14]OGL55142.1 MAG: PEP-CTERM-box response regulator transcription factor [Candidatus Schekmanbacteria bacterium RIFCSPLOW
MKKQKILIVEDDSNAKKQLKWAFSDEYKVFMAEDKESSVDIFKNENPQIVILDLGLSPFDEMGTEGLTILNEIITISPQTKVIVVTGNEDEKNALKAIRMGAHDYYLKPINIGELKLIVKRALNIYDLEDKNIKELVKELSENRFGEIIGCCPQMIEVFKFIDNVSKTDATVLILGESGTGKELVAKSIHDNSLRKEKPFIVINCTAIPENLLESELFGFEKGAFTGAYAQKKGKFEMAEGGTLFLDEIGELPLLLQVKLMRFLQEKEIERVGGNKKIKLDVRIITATNRDLKTEIEKKSFREDLYYRLNVVAATLPLLRERGKDIILIAKYFVKKFCEENKLAQKFISREAEIILKNYPWPGNARELENVIKRGVIMSQKSLINPDDLKLEEKISLENSSNIKSLKQSIEEMEIKFLKGSLERNKGFIVRAAKELGISRGTLYDLIKKYNIELD